MAKAPTLSMWSRQRIAGSNPVVSTKLKRKQMSIFATNFIIDEETGEKKLVKHLNKMRMDHVSVKKQPGGWNKSGKAARIKKEWTKGEGKK